MTPREKKKPEPVITSGSSREETVQHEQHVVADDAIPQRIIDALDRALAEGQADAGDGCTARLIDPPLEAGLVRLPRSSFVYVNLGDRRPEYRWVPFVALSHANVNGFNYLKAARLMVEASVPIYMALEHLHGRGEPWSMDDGPPGQVDYAAKKMCGVEKVQIDARVELDPSSVGSGSKTEFLKYAGTWLGFRKVNKLAARRAELAKPENYNPGIKLP